MISEELLSYCNTRKPIQLVQHRYLLSINMPVIYCVRVMFLGP